MMKYLLSFFLLIFINFGCSQIKEKAITEISQDELKTIFLLDVRTPEEFSAGHIKNAVNINLYDSEFIKKATAQLPKDKTIYVYCAVGARSNQAVKKLIPLGYTVVNLSGGYNAYKAKE